jgi:plastocyanin
VDRPGVLVATAGHLHPGGLYTDLRVRRHGRTAPLFRSKARYFEPAGAVSWDVAMTATPRNWRVKLRSGDVLSTSATYDTRRASWWESMGIMVAWMADGGGGKNPFKTKVNGPGPLTHKHLPENNNHGGAPDPSLPDARTLPDGSNNPGFVDLVNFRYQLGDLRLGGSAGNPPVIHPGQTLTFRDAGDDAKGIYHSITSCKAPCNRTTGIAYPIADGDVQFESGTLGRRVPATGSLEWQTPSNLAPGTYTYFCRIHPFMRGAFRVKQ